MAATFSVAQQYGSGAGSTSLLGATGSLWYFKQATTPGTSDYNTAGSNVPAGQNSFAVHLRPYFSTTATNTFSNIRFYQSTTWTSTTYGAVGTSATGYTQSTSSSTAIADGGASSVAVPTGSATDQAIALGSLTLGNASGYGPSYLRVQLTTNANAPAGDTPFGGFTWVEFAHDKLREFGEKLFESTPSQALILIKEGVETMREAIRRIEDIVRTAWRHAELSGNNLALAYALAYC